MISKKLYSENKVPPLTGFPLREGMENFDKPIERTDKSNTANIIDLIKSIRSDKDSLMRLKQTKTLEEHQTLRNLKLILETSSIFQLVKMDR